MFANLTPTGANSSAPPPPPPAGQPLPPPAAAETLDTTINEFTAGTLATSGHLAPFKGYGFGSAPPAGFPPLALTDAVMKELDRNTYFGVSHHNLSGVHGSMSAHGWDTHASAADPLFLRSDEAREHPWNRSCGDYGLAEGSPALKLGFRPIVGAAEIGLRSGKGRFGWERAGLNAREVKKPGLCGIGI